MFPVRVQFPDVSSVMWSFELYWAGFPSVLEKQSSWRTVSGVEQIKCPGHAAVFLKYVMEFLR